MCQGSAARACDLSQGWGRHSGILGADEDQELVEAIKGSHRQPDLPGSSEGRVLGEPLS